MRVRAVRIRVVYKSALVRYELTVEGDVLLWIDTDDTERIK